VTGVLLGDGRREGSRKNAGPRDLGGAEGLRVRQWPEGFFTLHVREGVRPRNERSISSESALGELRAGGARSAGNLDGVSEVGVSGVGRAEMALGR